ncbi:MAG: BatA domain-containing protein [Gemmatimonadota bacterium]|nr:BatA domain-containing protein [Gemmatimonadota bacterium]
MINFLNPLFLFALAAAAIPFLIHFLNRLQAGKQDFGSLMLLKEIQHRQIRKMKMRQWLLLALRTLIIASLVLVPARPVVKGLFRTGPSDHLPTAAVFILDTSASMGFVGPSGPACEFLLRRLERIYAWLNPADRYQVITADQGYRLIDHRWKSKNAAGPNGDPSTFPWQPGSKATNLGASLLAAAELLENETETSAREVYLFTDRQRGFLGTDSLELDLNSGIRWYLIEAHETGPENLSITSICLPGELLRPGAPLKAIVEVAHHGGTTNLQCLPRVYLDGRLVAQGEAVVPPDETVPVVVELPALETGIHELSARLDADGLEADNHRWAVVDVPLRARVLLIDNSPSSSSPDHLGTALEVMSQGPSSPITLERRNTLPNLAADISRYDVIILHGLDFHSGSGDTFWRLAAQRGAKVLALPSGSEGSQAANLKKFNSVLTRLGLPVRLGPAIKLAEGTFDTPLAPLRGAAASEANSVFAPLFEAVPGLRKIKIFARRSLPPSAGEGTSPVAAGSGAAAPPARDLLLDGGGTLLRLVRASRLDFAVAAVDLSDPAECELPGTPLFVPVLHGLICLLTHDGPLIGSSYRVGETVDIFFQRPVSSERMEIHGPGASRFRLPPGRLTRYSFNQTGLPGTYRLYDSDRLLGAFSIGLSESESDLRLEKRKTIEERFSGIEPRIIAPGEDLSQAVFLERGGVEAWPGLLIFALLLLTVEQLVANRKNRED